MTPLARFLLTVSMTLALAGCISGAIKPDDPLLLEPNEGLVGIQFDTLDKITQIQFRGADGGPTINVSKAEPGITTQLFRAPPGRYCLYIFHYGDWRITFDQGEDPLCVKVEAGKLKYGGRFAPRVVRGVVEMRQNYDEGDHFERMVRAKYPASERFFK